jgi:hypothetical protein
MAENFYVIKKTMTAFELVSSYPQVFDAAIEQRNKELAQQTNKKVKTVNPALCEGMPHGSCKGETMCDATNPCFVAASGVEQTLVAICESRERIIICAAGSGFIRIIAVMSTGT